MNNSLVVLDPKEGSMSRWEWGKNFKLRKTHFGTANQSVTFPVDLVQQFRMNPPDNLYIGPTAYKKPIEDHSEDYTDGA